MSSVNIHNAKTNLSRLIARAQKGEEIIIAKAGKPVVKLVPIQPRKRPPPGFGKGTLWISDDFDDPLPDDLLDLFYNGPIFPDVTSPQRARGRRRTTVKARK